MLEVQLGQIQVPPPMKRFLSTSLVLLLLGGVLWAAFPPLRRLPTVVSLLREELAAPLAVPVEGVRPAQLADTWGAPRSGGRRHEGIYIFAPCGRPVVSATRGLVLETGENALGGQVVRVLGPGGSVHYYAHLSRFGHPGLRGRHGERPRHPLPPPLRRLRAGRRRAQPLPAARSVVDTRAPPSSTSPASERPRPPQRRRSCKDPRARFHPDHP